MNDQLLGGTPLFSRCDFKSGHSLFGHLGRSQDELGCSGARRYRIFYFGGCVDRHVEAGRGGDTALIWEGNDPTDNKTYTYAELHAEVQQAANALKNLGIVKGDRVCIYMQMIPELVVAMLACARIGAIHSIVFAGFSPDASRVLTASWGGTAKLWGAQTGACELTFRGQDHAVMTASFRVAV